MFGFGKKDKSAIEPELIDSFPPEPGPDGKFSGHLARLEFEGILHDKWDRWYFSQPHDTPDTRVIEGFRVIPDSRYWVFNEARGVKFELCEECNDAMGEVRYHVGGRWFRFLSYRQVVAGVAPLATVRLPRNVRWSDGQRQRLTDEQIRQISKDAEVYAKFEGRFIDDLAIFVRVEEFCPLDAD